MATQALRAAGCRGDIGIVLNLSPTQPATAHADDLARARLEDGKLLRWYMDPLFGRDYPSDVLQYLGADAPRVASGDMTVIAAALDFLGVNYYTRSVASARSSWDAATGGLPLTDMGWEVYPQGLTELLVRLNRDYPVPPLYVTENGGAFADRIDDGRIHDPERVDYLASHIAAVAAACEQGVPMKGYMVWSLLDNFEWASGYAKRFGIVHVDYATQQRTLKDSALWYQAFVQRQHARRQASAPSMQRSGRDAS
jgi:beta-glucosidase